MTRAALWVALAIGALTTAHSDAIVVTGTVVDQAGKPVAGAEVWTWFFDADGRHDVRTNSADNGSFRLEVAPEDPRGLRVLAVAPGLAIGQAPIPPGAPGPLLLRLGPEAKVHGVAHDEEGDPVVGAVVRVRGFAPADAKAGDRNAIVSAGPNCPVQTVADAEGRFAIGAAPDKASVQLEVEADGFARWTPWIPREVPRAVAGAVEDYQITLERAAFIEGTLTHDGQLVPGVGVTAQGVGPTNGWDAAVSDAQGHYRLAHLGQGTFNIMIDRGADMLARAHEKVAVAPGDRVEGIDFSLTPGGVVEGRIVDADTGAPLPKAHVASYGPARPRSSAACISVLADENGVYRMRVAPGGNYVYYQGGVEGYPYSQDASFDIEVTEGETVKAPELRVKRAEPLTVKVLNAEGNGVADATVIWAEGPGQSAQTDPDGKCEVLGVPVGLPVVFIARDAAQQLSGVTVVGSVNPREPVTVTVQPSATVHFCLVDPDYKPLAGIRAHAYMKAQVVNAALEPWDRLVQATLSDAVSDGEGRVQFAGLPPGIAPSFSTSERTSNRVEWPECPRLQAGGEYDLAEVVLDLQRMAVRGTVVTKDETPVVGALVAANDWPTPLTTRTDQQGRFVIDGLLPAEPVPLLAASPDRRLFGAEMVVPEWELEPAIRLTKPPRVSGMVADGEGKPLAGQAIRAMPNHGAKAVEGFPISDEAKTDANGAFTLGPLVAGVEYWLTLGDRWKPVHLFTLEPGDDLDLGPLECADPGDG